MIKFCLAAAPRSGTTVFTRSIHQHPYILCGEECLHQQWTWRLKSHNDAFGNKIKACGPRGYPYANCSAEARANYIRRLYAQEFPDIQAMGIKILFHKEQVAEEPYEALRDAGVRIILVHRNPLECCVSHLQAGKAKKWHSDRYPKSREEGKLGAPKIALTTKWIKEYMGYVEKGFANIKKYIPNDRIMELDYHKDIREDFSRGMTKAQEFLEVEQIMDLTPQLKKIDNRPIQERVANWDAIVKALPGKYKHLLDTVQ